TTTRRITTRKSAPTKPANVAAMPKSAHSETRDDPASVEESADAPATGTSADCDTPVLSAAGMATSTIGAWTRNTVRQSVSCVTTPPSAGPTTAPTMLAVIHQRRAAVNP